MGREMNPERAMTDIRRVETWVVAILASVLLIFLGARWFEAHRLAVAVATQQGLVSVNVQAGQQHQADARVEAELAKVDDAKARQMEVTIAKLKAQLATLRSGEPNTSANQLIPPSISEAPVSSTVDPLVQTLLEAQDAQHALDLKRIEIRDSQIANLTAATDSWKAAAGASQIEVAKLRALASASETKWGVGAVYGSSGTAGVYVERAFGPIQVGVSVVRHAVAGGQTTLEAIASAGIRF